MNTNEMRIQSERWTIVIDAPKENTLEESKAFLSSIQSTLKDYKGFGFVASIIHDKDTEITGESKTIHSHTFIETPEKPTKKAFLETLVELLGINKDLIHIKPTNNDFLQVQYLIHKNDQTKAQYSEDAIVTNDSNQLKIRLNQKYQKKPSEQEIEEALFISPTLTDLIQKIGVDLARQNLNVFKALKSEEEQDIKALQEKLHRMVINLEHMERMFKAFKTGANLVLDENQKEVLKIDDFISEIDDILKKF